MQTAAPGAIQSVNTINTMVQVQGAYQGSVPAQEPGPPLALSLDDAVRRGLRYNLGAVAFQNSVLAAQGQQRGAMSALLPNVTAGLLVTDEQLDLAALGFSSIHVPGLAFPTVIGPFHFFDLRAGVSENVFNLTNLRNFRASRENARATQLGAQDARNLVVLAVTGTYLQVIAAGARVDSVRAQVATAQATFNQARDRFTSGMSPRIDMTRSQVELQTQEQRFTLVENDLAKQRIALERLIGLAPGQGYALTDTLPYAPLIGITLDQALDRAAANRSDLKAAAAQVHAAELARGAVLAERYPFADVAADYGDIGTGPANSRGTFNLTGSVRFPVFQGGRVSADLQQADAALRQRRAEYQDLRGRINAEVRVAFLDLNAAANQVKVADSNRGLARETLQQARDRFAAGVADTVEVVQAQEQVAAAELDYISSLFAHNLAKTSLARAMGQADEHIRQFLEAR